MNVQQTIRTWGNSAGVRLPKQVLKAANLKLYQQLNVDVKGNAVILTPVQPHASITLDDLLDNITPENLHHSVDFGDPVGKELV